MTISSIGVGSGLDVNSIVSQLVAIEKQPLQTLATKASSYQTQLSVYGNLNSQVSTLEDAAAALSTADGWTTQTTTSSNAAVATVTAGPTASATSFGLVVSNLAAAQTTASNAVAKGAGLGAVGDLGTLTINIGSWATGSFVGGSTPVTLDVPGIKGDDSLSVIAGKINAARSSSGASAGVTATVLQSGGQEQLVFRSNATGAEAGFQITSAGFAGLASLSFDNLTNPKNSTSGMVKGQLGLDAKATLNNVDISSSTNTFTDVLPGITLNFTQVGTTDITVAQDKNVIQTKVQAFADAYTALSNTLAASTKYVAGGTSGPLQGDSTTLEIQTLLRNTLFGTSGTGATATRLSDIGLELQKDGSLKLNTSKLTTAMADMG